MINTDTVLDVVRRKGPVVPNDVKKELKGDTMLIGAILSQLVSYQKLKISTVRIGGSPAYYAPETYQRLEKLMKYLKEKDLETANLLKKEKVLRDEEQSPLFKVSLRKINDFAKPLEVIIQGKKEIFWKWFTLSKQEAEAEIRNLVAPKKDLAKEELKVKEEKQEESKEEDSDTKNEILKEKQESQEKPSKEETEEKKVVKEDKVPKKETLKPSETKREEQRTLRNEVDTDDEFLLEIKQFFDEKGIEILEYDIIRKNSDVEMTVKMPTAAGKQHYFCKAKSKKTVNDGDLSSAFVEGQLKHLPVLFITKGKLTKKAQTKLEKDLKSVIVKQI
jgi:hypothetical protein